eukprot:scaffold25067_cov96-Isochrysis_galbana.AAC.2
MASPRPRAPTCSMATLWTGLHPGSVHLNRGNHEERSVHALYGFQRECMAKYDADVYELFSEAFEHLPLATLVNGQVRGCLGQRPGRTVRNGGRGVGRRCRRVG